MSNQPTPETDPKTPYTRTEIITTITDVYNFLAKLPYLSLTDIVQPPTDGWANVTSENFACLGKNEEVIELLKHLPYIRMDGDHEYMIAPSTHPCDYRRDCFQRPEFTQDCGPWVIPLTYGKNHGDYLMLDTSDGTAIVYQVTGRGWPHQYKIEDPRSWRNECIGVAQPLPEFLNTWKKKYSDLTWIGFPMSGWPKVWTDSICEATNIEEIRRIIRSYGWPDEFKRDECKQVLVEREERFSNRRRAEIQARYN